MDPPQPPILLDHQAPPDGKGHLGPACCLAWSREAPCVRLRLLNVASKAPVTGKVMWHRCFSVGCFQELRPFPGCNPDAGSWWPAEPEREARRVALPEQEHQFDGRCTFKAPPLDPSGSLAPTQQAVLTSKTWWGLFPNSSLNQRNGSGKRTGFQQLKRLGRDANPTSQQTTAQVD